MPSENINPDLPVNQTNSPLTPTGLPEESQSTDNAQPGGSPLPVRPLPFIDSRKPQKSFWPAVVLAMLVITGLVGWRLYRSFTAASSSSTEETAEQARLPVRVVQAQAEQIQGWIFDEGGVGPVRRRILNFQASGDITYVAKVNGVELREGDAVTSGQLLATIDNRRQVSSIETAQADIAVSVGQQNQAQAALLQAQAGLESAESDLALAQTELERYQMLFEEGAVPEADRDVASNRVDQAEAAVRTAQQDIRSAEFEVRSANAQIGASEARLDETAVNFEDTQLVSPIDGIVAYINIREGEYWDAQYLDRSSAQRVIETAPIVVMDPATFEVELEIQADAAAGIRSGQRAYVVLEEEVSAAQAAGATSQTLLDIARDQGTEGSVFSVSPSQTPGSRGTQVVVRNLRDVGNLRVGGRVYVWIEVASQNNAVVVPLGALLSRDQQMYAFVVNSADGTVQRRRVTQGIEGLSGVEILSGVEPGEIVVIEGQNRLVDGTPIEVINPETVN